jgi:hypothetical protein
MSITTKACHASGGNLNSELAQNLSISSLFRQLNVFFLYINFNKHGHNNDRYFRNYRYCRGFESLKIEKAIF